MTTCEPIPLAGLRPVGRCHGAGCAALLLAQDVWSQFDAEDRRGLSVVFASHKARRLCTACYRRVQRAGDLIDHDRVHRAAAERAEDYEWIRDDLPPAGSARRRLTAAANRQGCHPDTVRLALKRTGMTP